MNVWMRDRGLPLRASPARSMSCCFVRQRPATTARSPTARATSRTASKSWLEAIGNPASMMSTPSWASCSASATFSETFIEKPGDCSPSRSVVSKILMERMLVL